MARHSVPEYSVPAAHAAKRTVRTRRAASRNLLARPTSNYSGALGVEGKSMPPVTIENPILNSPYCEPTSHFRFDADDQITSIIDEGRRASSYFLPIAAPKKKSSPGLFDSVEEKKTESGHVNRVRQLVKNWREGGWPDVTPITRALLEHWTANDHFRPLFFCQVEALETLIFITEVAKQTKYGQDWVEKYLREKAEEAG